MALPLAHPASAVLGLASRAIGCAEGLGPRVGPAVHTSPRGRQQVRAVRPPARGKLWSRACPHLRATLLTAPHHQASSSSRRALAVLQRRTLGGKAEPPLPSPPLASSHPQPGRAPGGRALAPQPGAPPALLPLAPLCSSRMLAEREERRKSQLQMSGNLFIKQFLVLLHQTQPAEDIKKQYIEKVSTATAVLPTHPWPASALLQVPARAGAALLAKPLRQPAPKGGELPRAGACRQTSAGKGAGAPGQRLCSRFEQGAAAQSGEAVWSTGKQEGAAGEAGGWGQRAATAGQAGAGALQLRSRHNSVPGSPLANRCCTQCSSSEGCTRGWWNPLTS